MSTMIKIEKVLVLPSTLDLNTIYFVKNDTTNELKIVCTNNVGTIAYETNDQSTISTIVTNKIGDLDNLLTDNKTSLTAAINEIATQLVSITGPLTITQYVASTYTITDYDSNRTYTLSSTTGSVTRTTDTITYTPNTAGSVGFTINGRFFTVMVNPSYVNTPSINSPTNNAIDISLVPTFTASAFSTTGTTQTQTTAEWELATDSNFNNIVQSCTGYDNFTQWTPTSLNHGTNYYLRVRYSGHLSGASAWSAPITFKTWSGGWLNSFHHTSTGERLYAVSTDPSGNLKQKFESFDWVVTEMDGNNMASVS